MKRSARVCVRRSALLWTILLLTIMLTPSADAAADTSTPDYGEPRFCASRDPASIRRRMYWGGAPADIRIQVSDRPASHLVAWVFKLFLKEIYGYSDTKLVRITDRFNMSDYFEALNHCPGCPPDQLCSKADIQATADPSVAYGGGACRLPRAFVNLDAWTPGGYQLDDSSEALHDLKPVLYCGRLGPSTRIGWFVSGGSRNGSLIVLDHWRAFRRPADSIGFQRTQQEMDELAGKLTDTSGQYHCLDARCTKGTFCPAWCQTAAVCTVLLASNSNESGYVMDLILKYQLNVKVFWVGEHLSDIAALWASVNRPVLIAHFAPSSVTLDSSFVEVAFPPCDMGTACPMGARYLKKLAWIHMKSEASMAYKALRDFHLTQSLYESLLRQYAASPGRSYSQVACQWIRANLELVTAHWLTQGRPVNEIIIGGIFPIQGSGYTDVGVIPAVKMAVNAINQNGSVLRDYRLTLRASDGQCRSDMVMKNFIHYLRMVDFAQLAGILGPACSDTLEPIAGVSRHFKVLVITYSAEGVLLSNRKQYPYFFRTIGENKQFRPRASAYYTSASGAATPAVDSCSCPELL